MAQERGQEYTAPGKRVAGKRPGIHGTGKSCGKKVWNTGHWKTGPGKGTCGKGRESRPGKRDLRQRPGKQVIRDNKKKKKKTKRRGIRTFIIIGCAPDVDLAFPGVTHIVSSSQATLRHTRVSAYRCFLPDLTGFTGLRCAGPNCHRHLYGADPTKTSLDQEFDPAAADCRYRAPLPPHLAQPKFYQSRLCVAYLLYSICFTLSTNFIRRSCKYFMPCPDDEKDKKKALYEFINDT
jgi:hypothetical protein